MKGDEDGQRSDGEARWRHNRKKEKGTKRKGKRKSVLGDRNKVYLLLLSGPIRREYLFSHASLSADATSYCLLK